MTAELGTILGLSIPRACRGDRRRLAHGGGSKGGCPASSVRSSDFRQTWTGYVMTSTGLREDVKAILLRLPSKAE